MDDVLDELISNTSKRSYDDYLRSDFADERTQVQRGIALEKEIVAAFEQYVGEHGDKLGLKLVTVSPEEIDAARQQLYNGQYIAIDGRREKPQDVISGVFCEIGIASVGYKTLSEPQVRCMSITSHIDEATTKEEYYANTAKARVNENDITNAMIYWELEECLANSADAKWVFKDGPVMHPGLVWKESPTAYALLGKAVEARNIVGIVKDFRAQGSVALWRYGRCLKPYQYLVVYRGIASKGWIEDIGKEGPLAHDFKSGPGSQMVRGVFKASRSFWIFETHQDVVEQAMPVVMADALNSKRGMPQLVDLADQVLRKRFPSGLYAERINREFLHHGFDYYLDVVDERALRY